MARKNTANTANTTPKLEDTSWLAQSLADLAISEFEKNGQSGRWNSLNTLHTVINMADTGSATYDNDGGKRQIVITNPSYNLQCGLMGLAARYNKENTLIYVLATHDLNSAIITDLSELVYQMRMR